MWPHAVIASAQLASWPFLFSTTDTCKRLTPTGCVRYEFLTTRFLHLLLLKKKEQFLVEILSF